MLVVALMAWALGAGSLALFGIFLWAGGLGIFDLRLAHRWLCTFDAALCLIFFSQHSILIRRSVRDSLKRFIPEYCHGVAYTLSSSIALLALVLLWQRSSMNLYAFHGGARWITRGVLLLAFLGVFWGIRTLERFDAFGIEEFLAHVRGQQVPPPKLTVKGPYRLVRHPFYAFAIVALWATPVLSLDRLLLNVLFTEWILLGAMLEERDLLADFGEGYECYRRAVPMFVPRVRRWRETADKAAISKAKGHGG